MLALLLAGAVMVQGDTVRLRDAPCRACAIVIDTVVVLGDTVGPGEIDWQFQVARDGRSRYLVAHQGSPSMFSVFSSRGEFVRTVGRAGGGPGEFRRVWRIFPIADGVLVADDRAFRLSRFDLAFRFVGSRRLELTPLSAVLQADGSGVVSGVLQTPAASGFPIHEMDTLGRVSRAVGVGALTYREDFHELFVRDVATAGSPGRYWSSHRREYAFELRSRNESSVRTYLRPVEWFPRPRPSEVSDEDAMLNPPAPQLRGIAQEDSRHIWSLAWVPDRRWRTAIVYTGVHGRVNDWNLYYDTIVERIDLQTGAVVGSKRIDQVLWQFIAPGESYFHEPDQEGRSRAYVVRFTWER